MIPYFSSLSYVDSNYQQDDGYISNILVQGDNLPLTVTVVGPGGYTAGPFVTPAPIPNLTGLAPGVYTLTVVNTALELLNLDITIGERPETILVTDITDPCMCANCDCVVTVHSFTHNSDCYEYNLYKDGVLFAGPISFCNDPVGYYQFTGLCNGQYTVEAVETDVLIHYYNNPGGCAEELIEFDSVTDDPADLTNNWTRFCFFANTSINSYEGLNYPTGIDSATGLISNAPGTYFERGNRDFIAYWRISSAGAGYTPGTYTVPVPGTTGTIATFDVTINPTGNVSSVVLVGAGSGYTAPSPVNSPGPLVTPQAFPFDLSSIPGGAGGVVNGYIGWDLGDWNPTMVEGEDVGPTGLPATNADNGLYYYHTGLQKYVTAYGTIGGIANVKWVTYNPTQNTGATGDPSATHYLTSGSSWDLVTATTQYTIDPLSGTPDEVVLVTTKIPDPPGFPKVIRQQNNSSLRNGYYSVCNFTDYTHEVTVSSDGFDNDEMGIILAAYKDINGIYGPVDVVHSLTLLFIGSTGLAYLVYNIGQAAYAFTDGAGSYSTRIDSAPHPWGVGNFNGNGSVRFRITKTGSTITVENTLSMGPGGTVPAGSSNPYQGALLFNFDLLNPATWTEAPTYAVGDELEKFVFNSRIGYLSASQPDSFFYDVNFTGEQVTINDEIIDGPGATDTTPFDECPPAICYDLAVVCGGSCPDQYAINNFDFSAYIGQNITVTPPFSTDPECWYTPFALRQAIFQAIPQSQYFAPFTPFDNGTGDITISIPSLIYNGTEYIVTSPPSYLLTPANIQYVNCVSMNPCTTVPYGSQTGYINFTDFLNATLVSLGILSIQATPNSRENCPISIEGKVQETFKIQYRDTETFAFTVIFADSSATTTYLFEVQAGNVTVHTNVTSSEDLQTCNDNIYCKLDSDTQPRITGVTVQGPCPVAEVGEACAVVPRLGEPGFSTKNCDPDKVISVKCTYGDSVFALYKRMRLGIETCCEFDMDKIDIKNQLIDFGFIYDPDLCEPGDVVAEECCLAPCDAVAEVLIPNYTTCEAPTDVETLITLPTPPTSCVEATFTAGLGGGSSDLSNTISYKITYTDCCGNVINTKVSTGNPLTVCIDTTQPYSAAPGVVITLSSTACDCCPAPTDIYDTGFIRGSVAIYGDSCITYEFRGVDDGNPAGSITGTDCLGSPFNQVITPGQPPVIICVDPNLPFTVDSNVQMIATGMCV